jgi:prophage DNA circulation protein
MLITELSADARAVADLLLACPIGETVSLASMSDAIGRDIRKHRHIIVTARRVAEREAGAVFASVRGVGYQRLDAERTVAVVAPAARKHIARSAKRAARSLNASMSKANDLPMDVRRRAVHELGVLGIIEHAARERVKTLPDEAPTRPEPVAVVARRWLARMTG